MKRDSVSELWERSLGAINVQMQSRMLDPLLALLERGIVQWRILGQFARWR